MILYYYPGFPDTFLRIASRLVRGTGSWFVLLYMEMEDATSLGAEQATSYRVEIAIAL